MSYQWSGPMIFALLAKEKLLINWNGLNNIQFNKPTEKPRAPYRQWNIYKQGRARCPGFDCWCGCCGWCWWGLFGLRNRDLRGGASRVSSRVDVRPLRLLDGVVSPEVFSPAGCPLQQIMVASSSESLPFW